MEPSKYPLLLFPGKSASSADWDHFWFQFPFAFPGFLTTLLGVSASVFVLYRLIKVRQNRAFLLSILGVILSSGSLALLNSLRAVIADLPSLLGLHYKLYYLFLVLGPATHGMLYFLLEKRSKLPLFFLLANFVVMLPSYLALHQGTAFTGNFISYPFGNFATAELPLKLWAILNLVSYLVHLPALVQLYREKTKLQKNVYFHIAFHVNLLLTFSALPSLLGIPIYPGGHFYFVPSLILCFGILRDNYGSAKEFYFEKRGIFYITSGLTGFLLTVLAILFSFYFKPDPNLTHYSLYILPPLISTLFAYILSSYIGGINPEKELNVYGALSLASAGTMQIILIFRTLDLPVLIQLRIEQVLYIPFAFSISFFYRFIHLAMKCEIPKYLKYIDLFSLFVALSSLTPWMFAGYYEYPFGRYLKSGLPIQLLGVLVIFFNFKLLWKYLQIRKLKILTAQENQLIINYFIFPTLILLNLPATSGVSLYPLSNLNFIPFWLIGINVIRIGALDGHGIAARVSNRVALLSLLFIPILMSLYFFTLDAAVPFSENFLHCLLIGSFLLVGSYILTFLLTRPIVRTLEYSINQLELEKRFATEEKEKSEKGQRSIVKMNQIMKLVNSTLDLKTISSEIFGYLHTEFQVRNIWLLVVDQDQKQIYTELIEGDLSYVEETDRKFVLEFRKEVNRNLGALYFCCRLQKPIYFSNVQESKLDSEIDRKIAKIVASNSLLNLPLLQEKKTIGVLALNLTRNLDYIEKETIQSFCEQMSSAYNRTRLYRSIVDSEKATKELADYLSLMNEITKSVNESIEIDKIMPNLMEFVKEQYGIKYHALYQVDEEKMECSLISASFSEGTDPELIEKIKKLTIPLEGPLGGHHSAYQFQKVLYAPKLRKSAMTAEEIFVTDALDIRSFLLLPLIIGNKVLAILDLANHHGEKIRMDKTKYPWLQALGDQIAGSLSKSFLFQSIKKAETKSSELAFQMKSLNEISKEFNETLDMETILSKIAEYSAARFKLPYLAIWMADEERKFLSPMLGNVPEFISKDLIRRTYSIKLPLHPESKFGAHNVPFYRKKPLVIESMKPELLSEEEKVIMQDYHLKKVIMIPLLIKGESIGILNFQTFENTQKTTKSELNEMNAFVQQIAGAIYNASIVKNLNQAYQDLENSQDQLIQSEKMAALGQLVAGVAHEINTPLGAIKASIQNINNSLEETLSSLPKILQTLSIEEQNLLFSLVEKAKAEKKVLSTREERKARASLTEFLQEEGIPHAESIADTLVDIGVLEGIEPYLELFKSTSRDTLPIVYNLAGFQNKAKTIETAVEKASKIVFALKNYTHFDSSGQKQKVSLVDGIDTVLTIYQNSFKGGVELKTDFEEIPPIYCYPDELNQIWTNLIHNSLQAMEYKGKLSIRVFQESEESLSESSKQSQAAVVEIADNGPGIPKEIQEKIFQAFFTTKKRGEGSGLGLHITRKIIEKHNGTIDLQSEPGKTVFTIRIPYLESQEATSE